jgi:hypothetical protein
VCFLIGGMAGAMYMRQSSVVPAPVTEEKDIRVAPDEMVSAEGLLVINKPDLKPGAWFVVFEEKGERYAVELSFDKESTCFGKTASGACSPDRFIADRQVSILGIVNGETLLVREMRFPIPLVE